MGRVIDVVAAVIVNSEQEILCAQRSAEDRHPYKWEFPGGKIEPGESPEDALVRELKEELSIDSEIKGRIVSTSFLYESYDLNLTLFDVIILNGSLKPNVHHALKWIPLHEMESLEWMPADYPLLNKVEAYYRH